jgi:L-alanine-DL-glutamate epimerase-like enolase superfamily enzyme
LHCLRAILASIPNGIWCENMGLDDLWVDPLMIKNGMITAPERPGHGLRLSNRRHEKWGRSRLFVDVIGAGSAAAPAFGAA